MVSKTTQEDAPFFIQFPQVLRLPPELRNLVQQAEGTRYVDDLASNALRIPFCHAVLPEAKFIHVVRDGRESICEMLGGWLLGTKFRHALKTRLGTQDRRRSLKLSRAAPLVLRWANNWVQSRLGARKRYWGPTVPGQVEFAKSHSLPETVAYQWLKIVEYVLSGLREAPSDSVLQVRREHLISDPGGQIERVAEFLEVQDAGPMIDFANGFINPDRHDPVLRPVQPSGEEWAKILKLIEPMQRQLGYAKAPPSHRPNVSTTHFRVNR